MSAVQKKRCNPSMKHTKFSLIQVRLLVLQQRKVANDAALRQRYDNGDDPNDPHAGQQQNPFAHHGGGGNPFQFFQQQGGGGGGQGFPFQGGQKFKFEF
jgi:hypothetical protein